MACSRGSGSSCLSKQRYDRLAGQFDFRQGHVACLVGRVCAVSQCKPRCFIASVVCRNALCFKVIVGTLRCIRSRHAAVRGSR